MLRQRRLFPWPAKQTKKPRREEMAGLAKGLEVLSAFSAKQPCLTLSGVAAATGLAPAIAQRCVLTLERRGFVGCVERRFFCGRAL